MQTAGADADDAEAANTAEDAAVPSISGRGVTAYGGVTEDAGARVGRSKKAPVKVDNHARAQKGKMIAQPLTGMGNPSCTVSASYTAVSL